MALIGRLPFMRIFVCGAHSTGKTTLHRHLAEHIGIYGEPEIARPLIAGMGLARDQFDPHHHPDVFERIQREMLRVQCDVERRLDTLGQPYICDRGLDPLIYAEMYLGPEVKNKLLSEPFVQESLQRHRQSLVLLVTPHDLYVVDDGFRLKPDIAELRQYTQHMMTTFDQLGIDYYVIDDVSVPDRVASSLECIAKHLTRQSVGRS